MYECQHCKKQYKFLSGLENHEGKCPVKTKIEACKTLVGTVAYNAFQYWMLRTKRVRNVDINTFMKSRYFGQFIRFSNFYLNTSVGPMETYMNFLIKQNLDPYMWIDHRVFARYIIEYNSIVSPNEQWGITFDEIESLCQEYDCLPNEIFVVLGFEEVVKRVLNKKFSPWYLLLSDAYWRFHQQQTEVDRDTLLDLLQVNTFHSIAGANPGITKEIKDLIQEIEN